MAVLRLNLPKIKDFRYTIQISKVISVLKIFCQMTFSLIKITIKVLLFCCGGEFLIVVHGRCFGGVWDKAGIVFSATACG